MYLFIVNKNSGNGEGRRVWEKIAETLDHRGILYEHIFTHSAEEAHTYLVERLAATNGWDAVGVVGGDGTIHSLLTAMRGTGIPLAVFPAGSGNDTARGFRIPKKTKDALHVLLEGTPLETDLIATEGDNTLTALAVGFDAEVAHNVNNSRYKKICNRLGLGRAAYIIGVFHTLLTFRPAPLTVDIDGNPHRFDSAWLAAINNVTSYGGGLKICPDAKTDDGQLDICIVHGCSRLELLLLFPTLLFGRHTRLPFVTMLRGRNVTVHSSLPRMALGDGERVASTPVIASADPGSLRIMCPNPPAGSSS